MAVIYTSREEIEVYRFSLPVAIGIPLLALFAQAFIPLRFPLFSIFDLPLLVTIFFALARRSQVTGLLTGSVIGLVQDSLTHNAIGIFGIAKTVVGYAASSLGVKLDVENAFSRMLVTFGFYVVHQIIYISIARGMVGQELGWRWGHMVLAALANALLAVPVFAVLDHLKQRA